MLFLPFIHIFFKKKNYKEINKKILLFLLYIILIIYSHIP